VKVLICNKRYGGQNAVLNKMGAKQKSLAQILNEAFELKIWKD
jgi:hypothetical protein